MRVDLKCMRMFIMRLPQTVNTPDSAVDLCLPSPESTVNGNSQEPSRPDRNTLPIVNPGESDGCVIKRVSNTSPNDKSDSSETFSNGFANQTSENDSSDASFEKSQLSKHHSSSNVNDHGGDPVLKANDDSHVLATGASSSPTMDDKTTEGCTPSSQRSQSSNEITSCKVVLLNDGKFECSVTVSVAICEHKSGSLFCIN